MTTHLDTLREVASRLDRAARTATPIPQISVDTSLTTDDAWTVQALTFELRQDRGETLVGVKMGFTSRAKARQMGVEELIGGRLSSSMMAEDGGQLVHTCFIHPRVEPEVAFLLKRPLHGPVSPAEAALAVEAIAPALEVIDSRYRDFRFSLADVIADNASSAAFVLGPWASPHVDVANLGMLLEIDGHAVEIGSSAAILGHPLRSLAAASKMFAQRGLTLPAGAVVLAGGATAAVPFQAGRTASLTAERIGRVSLGIA